MRIARCIGRPITDAVRDARLRMLAQRGWHRMNGDRWLSPYTGKCILVLRHARCYRHRTVARRLCQKNAYCVPMSGANGVADLEKKFCGHGYVFRCFPSATCEALKFQAGRIEVEDAIIPAHIATGSRQIELRVEVFRLVACAATADELSERLSDVAPTAPRYHELLE